MEQSNEKGKSDNGMTSNAPTMIFALNRSKVLEAAKSRPRVVVMVPADELEPGAYVRVQELSADERDTWEDSLVRGRGTKQKVDMKNVRAKLFQRVVVDEGGELMFTPADIPMIGRLPSRFVDRVYEAATRQSKISDEDVEELMGNSPNGR